MNTEEAVTADPQLTNKFSRYIETNPSGKNPPLNCRQCIHKQQKPPDNCKDGTIETRADTCLNYNDDPTCCIF